MKKWILSISLLAGAIGLAGCGAGEKDVVATSKAGDVSQQELYDAMKEQYSPQIKQTLEQLMTEKVLSEKYKVSDKELDQELKKAKEQLGSQYDAFLAQYNMDEKGFKDFLKLQLLQEKAATADIKVSDKELKEYYDKWQAPIKVRHILVADEKKAAEVKDKLAKGAKFGDLAKEYSTDTGSAQNGGELGWVDNEGRQQFVPEFTKALSTLKKGEISKPIKSDYGYHIIEITDTKEKKPFKDLKAELEKELKKSKVDPQAVEKKLHEALKSADVEVKDKDLKGAFDSSSESSEKTEDTEAK